MSSKKKIKHISNESINKLLNELNEIINMYFKKITKDI